jgi:ABC-2 type transport system permease protein
MNKILVVAGREYKAAVRTKSFVISLLVMPLLMFGGAGVQILLESHADIKDKIFAVIDRTPGEVIYPELQKAAQKRNENDIFDPKTNEQIKPKFVLIRVPPSEDSPHAREEQRLAVSQQVRDTQIWGFVEIGRDVCQLFSASARASAGLGAKKDDRRALRYQTNHLTYEAFPLWLQTHLPLAILHQGAGINLDENKLATMDLLALQREGLTEERNGKTVEPTLINQIARLIVPAALTALMFMMIMLSSTSGMHGVVEEKMQRIAEVLLGSISPFQLMLGKLMGLMAVSLTVAAVYLSGAYGLAYHYGVAEYLGPSILAWFVLFQVLAIVMYGSLFLAVGSAATDIKETQTLVMPIILLACLPMFVLRNALDDPNGSLVVAASFFPPVTPMLMMARIAISPGPVWWQPVLGVLLTLGVTILCVYAAGRIFRVGILMQGKGARLGQLFRWVIRG